VNEKLRSGIRRATDAAWDKLPEALTAAVVVIVVFSGGLWLDLRDARHTLQSVVDEQAAPRLCERIGICTSKTGGARDDDAAVWAVIHGMRQTLNEREARISHLEEKVYEISSKPSARPDPFTGTEGRELSRRLEALEKLENVEHHGPTRTN